ncbi:MAG: hypothetical protein ABI193_03895 [Minicystis sp.]
MTRADQLRFFLAHPPASLGGLVGAPDELPDYPFDGHGGDSIDAVFRLECPCGCDEFRSQGHAGEDGTLPPITVTCEECGRATVLFDPRLHGFDGAVGNNAGLHPTSGEPVDLQAEDNDEVESPCALYVRFEYPTDLFGGGAPPAWKGREQELYSWITLVGLMDELGELGTLFEYECA